MTREVIFAPEALTDLLKLFDYIAAEAGAERASTVGSNQPVDAL